MVLALLLSGLPLELHSLEKQLCGWPSGESRSHGAGDWACLHLFTWSPSVVKVLAPQLPNLQPKLTAHALHAGVGESLLSTQVFKEAWAWDSRGMHCAGLG